MNENPAPSAPHADPASEIRSLASGIRAVALVFVLILGYFNVRLAFQIPYFHVIFSDMLGDKPLPGITTLVTQGQFLFLLLAFLIPLAAIAVVAAVRPHKTALYSLAALMVLTFVQMHLVWSALSAPLFTIIRGLSGN